MLARVARLPHQTTYLHSLRLEMPVAKLGLPADAIECNGATVHVVDVGQWYLLGLVSSSYPGMARLAGDPVLFR